MACAKSSLITWTINFDKAPKANIDVVTRGKSWQGENPRACGVELSNLKGRAPQP